MHPILFKLGPITIHTYGFFVALGFIAAIMFASKEAEKQGINSDKIMDLSFYALVSGLIGARLFYVITEWDNFYLNPIEIFKIWNGGLVFFGGFITAVITIVWYIKKTDMQLWKIFDIMSPSIAIGHFFGRIGCFSAGCCYGRICDLPWAVTFTHPATLARANIPLHPVQLYSAFTNLFIFIILVLLIKRKKFEGQIFISYLFLYSIGRMILEFFRGDDRGNFVLRTFSPAQAISLIMAIAALALFFILRNRRCE
ncbi:Phosphatidylglycerol--prolipoprotein diacylglyceryl transferase [Candidatus Magnetomoraceae bacterium gMMP-15]